MKIADLQALNASHRASLSGCVLSPHFDFDYIELFSPDVIDRLIRTVPRINTSLVLGDDFALFMIFIHSLYSLFLMIIISKAG